jgi:RES domain
MTTAPALWQASWVAEHYNPLTMEAWRGVETQHIAATLRLVDNNAEQDLLESLLDSSKPPYPPKADNLPYLLSTPFRYKPQQASRFRRAHESGLWYGAASVYAVCAELAYWRMRFVQDSAGLVKTEVLTQHTLFQATVQGEAIDLTAKPWTQAHTVWAHPSDYTGSHALGSLIRDQDTVQWIRYESVRAPGHLCAAVFNPHALRMNDLRESEQRWFCKTTAQRVLMSDGTQSFEWTE